jgi:hypothetical protein
MIFEHGKDFFAKDNECLRSIDMGKRMEGAVGIKNAISNKAMDERMPCQKIAKGLDGCDEAGLKRFMGENGAKELIDSFSCTLRQESEQFSVAIEEPAQYFGDSKHPLTVSDVLQYIIFDPGSPEKSSFLGA